MFKPHSKEWGFLFSKEANMDKKDKKQANIQLLRESFLKEDAQWIVKETAKITEKILLRRMINKKKNKNKK